MFTDIEGSTAARRGARSRLRRAPHAGTTSSSGPPAPAAAPRSARRVTRSSRSSGPPETLVEAAIRVQRAMAAEPWTRGADVKVRIGIHTGEAELAAGVYVGIDVHRAARIMAAAHGGQILVSEATRALVSRAMPAGASLRDLGEHQLKDLPAPERLYQVNAEGLDADFPPPRTIDSTPNNLPVSTIGAGRTRGRARAAGAPAARRHGPARDADRTGRDRQDPAGRPGGDRTPSSTTTTASSSSTSPTRASRSPSSSRSPRRRASRSRAIATCARRSRRTSGRASSCSCSTTSSR